MYHLLLQEVEFVNRSLRALRNDTEAGKVAPGKARRVFAKNYARLDVALRRGRAVANALDDCEATSNHAWQFWYAERNAISTAMWFMH